MAEQRISCFVIQSTYSLKKTFLIKSSVPGIALESVKVREYYNSLDSIRLKKETQ
jgi:hypothetical protein